MEDGLAVRRRHCVATVSKIATCGSRLASMEFADMPLGFDPFDDRIWGSIRLDGFQGAGPQAQHDTEKKSD